MNERALLLGIGLGAAAWLLSRNAQAAAAQQLWNQHFAPAAPYDPLAGRSIAQLAQDFGSYAGFLTRDTSSAAGTSSDTTTGTTTGIATRGEETWWFTGTTTDIEDLEAGGVSFYPVTMDESPGKLLTPWDMDDAEAGAFMRDPWDKTADGAVQPIVFVIQPGENWRVNLYPELASTIAEYAGAYGVPLETFERLLYQESRYREDIVYGGTRSAAGASGVAQFMPDTARQYGLYVEDVDLRGDPVLSIEAAAKYLSALYRTFGNWPHAAAAYNFGPGNMRKYLRGEKSLPGETMRYVAGIFGPGTTLTA